VLTVNDGDDLEQLAKRAVYADFRVGEINTAKGEEFMELRYPGGEVYLALGQAHGEVDALAVQREMIRRTIKEHLEKEKLLRPKGIKVLSLFFIESVARYRQYDKDGNPVKGDYARIFEEEYRRPPSCRPSRACSARWTWRRRPRPCTTATSPSTRRAAGPTPSWTRKAA
jgi:type III restriction enzyme